MVIRYGKKYTIKAPTNFGWGVAVDSLNNIIVTGYFRGASNSDYFTIKYEGIPPVDTFSKRKLPLREIMSIVNYPGRPVGEFLRDKD
jgi:hypothetical protein